MRWMYFYLKELVIFEFMFYLYFIKYINVRVIKIYITNYHFIH